MMRTASYDVTFQRPFLLTGFETLQAAGTYTVDTVEELINSISFVGWKRVLSTIQLPQGGATEYVRIDSSELSEALIRDGAQSAPAARSETAEHARRKRISRFLSTRPRKVK